MRKDSIKSLQVITTTDGRIAIQVTHEERGEVRLTLTKEVAHSLMRMLQTAMKKTAN